MTSERTLHLGPPPPPTRIGARTFVWGERTFVMGILNVTPDSFSGDGLLQVPDPLAAAVDQERRMLAEGADLLYIGGESTRPGHVPIVAAVRAALPDTPLSIDTTKVVVAEAAIAAGADLLNDIWGVGADPSLAELAASTGTPLIVMHNREEPRYEHLVPEVIRDLRAALQRAERLGVRPA